MSGKSESHAASETNSLDEVVHYRTAWFRREVGTCILKTFLPQMLYNSEKFTSNMHLPQSLAQASGNTRQRKDEIFSYSRVAPLETISMTGVVRLRTWSLHSTTVSCKRNLNRI